MLKFVISLVALFAVSSNASTLPLKLYQYPVVRLLNNDDLASNCPELKNLQVGDAGNLSKIMVQMNGSNVTLKTTGESRTCYSDMVCPTQVSFGTDRHYSKIVLTRNNDGNYPTTNLEGFSDVTVDLSETPRFGSYYCRYELPVAY
jgi:hypothetical protein